MKIRFYKLPLIFFILSLFFVKTAYSIELFTDYSFYSDGLFKIFNYFGFQIAKDISNYDLKSKKLDSSQLTDTVLDGNNVKLKFYKSINIESFKLFFPNIEDSVIRLLKVKFFNLNHYKKSGIRVKIKLSYKDLNRYFHDVTDGVLEFFKFQEYRLEFLEDSIYFYCLIKSEDIKFKNKIPMFLPEQIIIKANFNIKFIENRLHLLVKSANMNGIEIPETVLKLLDKSMNPLFDFNKMKYKMKIYDIIFTKKEILGKMDLF